MNTIRRALLLSILPIMTVAFSAPAAAGERATPQEAIAMVKKAIVYIKENGKEKALAEFSSPGSKFRDRDLYLTVTDMNGMTLAHGANTRLIGKNLLEVKDADGKQFIKLFVETAKTKGSGWVDYKWPNPVTSKIEEKATYVEKIDDMVIGAGVYK